jgi:hypothetical protein
VSYPEGYEIHGIDISHHQGRINWDELKENGTKSLSYPFCDDKGYRRCYSYRREFSR